MKGVTAQFDGDEPIAREEDVGKGENNNPVDIVLVDMGDATHGVGAVW